MALIIDADKGRAIQSQPLTNSISDILSQIVKTTEIEENNLFIISSEGDYCKNSALISDYITEDYQFLVIFKKDKINLDFPVIKSDWTTYKNFASINIKFEPFTFPDKYASLYSGMMKIYEKQLFELSNNMSNTYAQYRASLEFVSDSNDVLKNRLKASQAILNSCVIYSNNTKDNILFIEEKILCKQRFIIQKSDLFKSITSTLINRWDLSVTQSEMLMDFPNALKGKCDKLRDKIRASKYKIIEFEKGINKELENLTKLEMEIGNLFFDKVLDDHEKMFQEGFKVCSDFSDYNAIMKKITQDCEDAEKNNYYKIEAVNRFYKACIKCSHKCIYYIKRVLKRKMNKYLLIFKKLEEISKILEVNSIILDPQKTLEHDINCLGNMESDKFLDVIQKCFIDEAKCQGKFLDTYARITPLRGIESVEIFYNCPIKACKHTNSLLEKKYDPNIIIELKQAPEVSEHDIHNYYKKIIEMQQMSFIYNIEIVNSQISILSRDVENIDYEIEDLLERKKNLIKINEKLSIMKNGFEEEKID